MLCAADGDGQNNCHIAEAVGVTSQTVRTWRERFPQGGMDGLSDELRSGALRKRPVLISATGPDSNVMKIRPPLIFSAGDADRLLRQLEDNLQSI